MARKNLTPGGDTSLLVSKGGLGGIGMGLGPGGQPISATQLSMGGGMGNMGPGGKCVLFSLVSKMFSKFLNLKSYLLLPSKP